MKIYPEYVAKDRVMQPGQEGSAVDALDFVWKGSRLFDYGWRGVALIVLFYLFINRWWLSLPVVFSYMFWWGLNNGSSYHLFGLSFGMEMFAMAALPLIYIHTHSGLKINKWVFYLFYPGHLIGMLLIELALKTM